MQGVTDIRSRLARLPRVWRRPHPDEVLPAPVLARIDKREWSSELLMRIVQLGIVATFGVLYFLSPRTDAETSFSLVPAALALYLVLTLIGIAWSWRMKVPDWAAVLSIIFDIGLLMVLIWSFHWQYGQPPSFYLKAPSFLYVFIFIALRALRFDPKFVLLAGVATILAWSAMVLFVLATDETGSVVTRDYVRYLTSNALLIGAEVDKLISVAVVTGILYVTLLRGRALLVQAASERIAATNLSRFFDASVAARIRRAEDLSAQGVRREAAVLFVDLRNFTQLTAQLEPQAVIEVLNEYQRRVGAIVHDHGGVIDKFIGDGIMATFGAAETSSAYAANALRTVDAIMTDSSHWPSEMGPLGRLPPQAVAAAVAAGPVIFGTIGGDSRLELTVIGPAVNLAAKLEKLNKAVKSRALATVEAYRLATRQGYEPGRPTRSIEQCMDGANQHLVLLHR